MPREQAYQSVIIKKQPLGEADEIITLFTAEAGKVRALAKGVKLSSSKLQQSLQPIFLNEIRVAGNGGLPKIIGVQIRNAFLALQSHPERVKVWFVVAELLQKFLPDEQKNPDLFNLVIEYLKFLDAAELDPENLTASLVKFKIAFLESIGLGIHAPAMADDASSVLFSANRGGFYAGQPASDSRAVDRTTWQAFLDLQNMAFADLNNKASLGQLPELVNQFISWQLEREIKADRFLEP